MPPTSLIYGKQPLGTVAYISRDHVPEPFCIALAQLISFCYEYVVPPGRFIHPDHSCAADKIPARNELVQKMQGEWLLQLDSDQVFEPDLLLRLLQLFEAHDLDVLTGLYTYKQPPYNAVLYQYKDDGYHGMLDWERQFKLLPVGAAGAGCLLVRRRVFDRIKAEQKALPFDPVGIYKTDDFSFFERCRLLDIKCWTAPQVELEHLSTRGVGAKDFHPELFHTSMHIQVEGRQ
jgi:hypothetical protein